MGRSTFSFELASTCPGMSVERPSARALTRDVQLDWRRARAGTLAFAAGTHPGAPAALQGAAPSAAG